MIDYTIARGKGGAIAWTEEQVAYIIDKYTKENYTLAQLGREFNVAYGTIKLLLKKHHCFIDGYKRGYPRKEFYFLDINTAEKAYWLGFLYADGCITSGNSIEISLKDKTHLEKFQKAIGAINHKITTIEDTRWDKPTITYHFSFRDKQMWNDLNHWGCVPNKSLVLESIPNIPRNYISHFIRGYFDGDGSLHYLKGTNNYRISFVGTKEFLQDIQKELEVQTISIQKPKMGKHYQLQISGRKQVERILNYLYKDSVPETRLDRKYQLYLNCLEWAHRH